MNKITKIAIFYLLAMMALAILCGSCGTSKKAKKEEVIDYSAAVMVDSTHRVASISFYQDSTKTVTNSDSSFDRVTTDIFEYAYDSSTHYTAADYAPRLLKHTRETKEKGRKVTQTTKQEDKKKSESKVDSTGKSAGASVTLHSEVKEKTKSSNTIPLWILLLIIGAVVLYFGWDELKKL